MICSQGIRVVECAVLFNGDTVGMWLGDMGADVIKVESPTQGDYLRDMLGQIVPHHSPAHLQVNKNKRSMTLDLRRDEGRERVLGPAAHRRRVRRRLPRRGVRRPRHRLREPAGGQARHRLLPLLRVRRHRAVRPRPHPRADDERARRLRAARHRRRRPRARTARRPSRWAAPPSAATAPRPARSTPRCTSSPPWSAGPTPARGVTSTRPGPTASSPRAGSARPTRLNSERITDRTGLRRPGDTERTSAKYNFYEAADDRYVLFCAIEHKFWKRFCEAVERPGSHRR